MKRTKLFSNSKGIRCFQTTAAMIRKAKAKKPDGPKLTKRWIDAAGRERFQGNADLKKSQLRA